MKILTKGNIILQKHYIFKIIAKNEGRIASNTARMEIKDGSQVFSLITGLKKDEEAEITLHKK